MEASACNISLVSGQPSSTFLVSVSFVVSLNIPIYFFGGRPTGHVDIGMEGFLFPVFFGYLFLLFFFNYVRELADEILTSLFFFKGSYRALWFQTYGRYKWTCSWSQVPLSWLSPSYLLTLFITRNDGIYIFIDWFVCLFPHFSVSPTFRQCFGSFQNRFVLIERRSIS